MVDGESVVVVAAAGATTNREGDVTKKQLRDQLEAARRAEAYWKERHDLAEGDRDRLTGKIRAIELICRAHRATIETDKRVVIE